MQKRIIWLGIFCSIMIPAVGILSRRGPVIPEDEIPIIWTILSVFLMGMWLINYYLTVYLHNQCRLRFWSRIGVVAFCDLLVLMLYFLLIELNLLPISRDYYNVRDSHLLIRLGFAIILVSVIQYAFVGMYQKEKLSRQNAQLRYENLMAELESLKQQINPHFLFNSLGTLRAMIHEKDENAEQFVLRLAAVYRHFLAKRNEPVTTLKEELVFLESYLYMLGFRYEGCLQMIIELDEHLGPWRLPAFSLQLLVENCIKHNVLTVSRPLTVRIYQRELGKLTIVNNRQPKRTEIDSTGFGLENLRQRYKLLGIQTPIMIEETDAVFAVSITLIDA